MQRYSLSLSGKFFSRAVRLNVLGSDMKFFYRAVRTKLIFVQTQNIKTNTRTVHPSLEPLQVLGLKDHQKGKKQRNYL
jgi:hypothetical protein